MPYLFQYNRPEGRYYMIEISDPSEYQRLEFNLVLHAELAKVSAEQRSCSTQCPACQLLFRSPQHKAVHYGYHGVRVQAPSERDEFDPSIGDSGMCFSIQSIIEARILHSLDQTLTALPARDGHIDLSDVRAKISTVLEKQERLHVRRGRVRKVGGGRSSAPAGSKLAKAGAPKTEPKARELPCKVEELEEAYRMEPSLIFFCAFVTCLVLGMAGALVGVGLWFHRRIEKRCAGSDGTAEAALEAKVKELDTQMATFAKDVHDSFLFYLKDPAAMVNVDPTSNTLTMNSPPNTTAVISLNNAMISSNGSDLFLSGPSTDPVQNSTSVKLNGSGLAVLNGHLRNAASDVYGVSFLIDGGMGAEGGATNVDKIIASLERNGANEPGVGGGSHCGSDSGDNSDGGGRGGSDRGGNNNPHGGGGGRAGHDDGSSDEGGNGSSDGISLQMDDEYPSKYGGAGFAGASGQPQQPPPRPYMDPRKELELKREALYQIDRLAKKGVSSPRVFTLSSSLEEMQAELERLKRDRDLDKSVNFQRYMMMTTVTGLEMLTNTFASRYVKLDGWSNHVNDNVNDFDDIFEELHAKWSNKAKMPPELRLIMSLGGSAAMFHMTNTMVKKYMPGMDQVLKSNPGLMKQVSAAMMNTVSGNMKADEEKEGSGNLMSGLFNMMGGLMGGPGQGQGHAHGNGHGHVHGQTGHGHPHGPTTPVMKGPRNFDAMMKELNSGSRLETFSNASETDISELRDDARSIGGYSLNSRSGRKVLNI
ncbi:hypothetical protein HXX76_014064 [Chlamydomonas incerta]|uniref:Uncharacterized protein n=1 Tax=Chlamydomonas incerta TaxID=51695 RepID=A0A835SG48_CHLIN|nr:hypothetical protein HXX76_014064 [Chlamydomonas incerta]|eukprot:KAG2424906.1 hypothetical protein HXX76_014064 [Chlamydomonas incerta]